MLIKCYHVVSTQKQKLGTFINQFQRDEFEFDPVPVSFTPFAIFS